MNSKPTVILALPVKTSEKMFKPGVLDRLRHVAELVGPIEPNDAGWGDAFSRATVAITGWGTHRLSAALLDSSPELRLIAHSAGTVKSIVDESIFERGVRITSSAAANAQPVAQLTVALMVSLLKQMPWIGQAYMSGDDADRKTRVEQLRELQDMTVGLIGASRVGREVVRFLKSYPRLEIKVYDPYLSEVQANELGVMRSTLEEACACEVVSVHAPNLPETHHMLNARTLSLLPDHAVLVNTSRGALIDEAALLAELKRRPLYVALDVTDPEPLPANSPLRDAPNLVITPHVAGACRQAQNDMGELAVEEVLRFLRGDRLQCEITEAMFASQA